jgi:hypothetical protein
MDSLGKAFSGSATTVDITRNGARLRGITVPLRPGEVIGIHHESEKARFRVAWVGRIGQNSGQIGVCCVEPGKYIWSKPLAELQRMAQAQTPAKPTAPRTPTVAVAPNTGTPAQRSGLAVKAAPDPPSVVKKIDDGRRIAARFSCRGGAELRDQSGNRLWGTVSDLSMTGCYVETFAPLAPGARVQLNITVENTELHAVADVKTSHPTMGMGLSFTEMSSEDRERLDHVVHQFASFPVMAADADPSLVRSGSGEHEKFDSVVQMLSAQMQQLEVMLSSEGMKVAPQLSAELRSAADVFRHSAILVQKWMACERENRDSFEVIEELELQRLNIATKMLHDLALDVDSANLHLGTPGLAQLREAIDHLQRRVDKLAQPDRGFSK